MHNNLLCTSRPNSLRVTNRDSAFRYTRRRKEEEEEEEEEGGGGGGGGEG